MNNELTYRKLYSFHNDMNIYGTIPSKYCQHTSMNGINIYYDSVFEQKDSFNPYTSQLRR